VKVTWETRLSDISEAEITGLLSYFSTVTKYRRDVGIDFYCELLENDSPSVPFYIQAKGTEHFDGSWGAGVRKSTILYWLQQPSPVFLVVYDEKGGNCYWMSIEDLRDSLIQKIFETNSKTIYIGMDRSHILERGKDKNKEFMTKIKGDLGSVELFRGRPTFRGDGYVKLIPAPPRSEVELRRIRENIRGSLYSLLVYYFFQQNDLPNAYLLGEFLTKFDRGHYNHFVWFGQINKALGKPTEARKSFEEALRICEEDRNWPRQSIEDIIARIKKDIESCR
jgi:hypothetical protein